MTAPALTEEQKERIHGHKMEAMRILAGRKRRKKGRQKRTGGVRNVAQDPRIAQHP